MSKTDAGGVSLSAIIAAVETQLASGNPSGFDISSANMRQLITAAKASTPARCDGEPDIRWAVNILLEKIAEKFEGWDTHDIWRSDAAATVRGLKHDFAVPVARCETVAWLYEMAFKIKPSDDAPFSNWKQVVTLTPPPTIPEGGVRNVVPFGPVSRCDAGSDDPFNRKQVEAVCRAVCKVEGVVPDDDVYGDGCDPQWLRYADAVAAALSPPADGCNSPVVCKPAPAPTSGAGSEARLRAALDLAINIIMANEPGDSRAVSNEAVALAAVACGDTSEPVMAVIRAALATPAVKPSAQVMTPRMKPLATHADLLKQLAESKAAWDKMTDKEKDTMLRKQQESWTRQDMD